MSGSDLRIGLTSDLAEDSDAGSGSESDASDSLDPGSDAGSSSPPPSDAGSDSVSDESPKSEPEVEEDEPSAAASSSKKQASSAAGDGDSGSALTDSEAPSEPDQEEEDAASSTLESENDDGSDQESAAGQEMLSSDGDQDEDMDDGSEEPAVEESDDGDNSQSPSHDRFDEEPPRAQSPSDKGPAEPQEDSGGYEQDPTGPDMTGTEKGTRSNPMVRLLDADGMLAAMRLETFGDDNIHAETFEELVREIKNLRDTRDELNVEVDQWKGKDTGHRTKIKQCEKDLEEKILEIEVTDKQVEEWRRVAFITKKLDELEQDPDLLMAQLDRLRVEFDDLHERYESLAKVCENKEKQEQQLRDELQAKDMEEKRLIAQVREMKAFPKQKLVLEKEIEAKNAKYERAKAEITEIEKKVGSEKEKNVQLEYAANQMREMMIAMKEKHKETHQNNKAMKKEVDRYEGTLQTLQNQLRENESRCQTLQAKHDEMEEQYTNEHDDYERINNRKNKLEKDLASAMGEVVSLKSTLQTNTSWDTLQVIVDDLTTKQAHFSEVEQQSQKYCQQMQRIMIEYKTCKADMEDWKHKYEDERQENLKARATHTRQIRKMTDLHKMKESKADSKREIEHQRAKKLEVKMSDMEQISLETEKKMDDLSSKHNKLRLDYETSENENSELRKKNEQLEEVMNNTHIEVEKLLRALREMEYKLDGLKDQELLEEEVQSLESRLKDTERQLEKKQSQLQVNFKRYESQLKEAQMRAQEQLLQSMQQSKKDTLSRLKGKKGGTGGASGEVVAENAKLKSIVTKSGLILDQTRKERDMVTKLLRESNAGLKEIIQKVTDTKSSMDQTTKARASKGFDKWRTNTEDTEQDLFKYTMEMDSAIEAIRWKAKTEVGRAALEIRQLEVENEKLKDLLTQKEDENSALQDELSNIELQLNQGVDAKVIARSLGKTIAGLKTSAAKTANAMDNIRKKEADRDPGGKKKAAAGGFAAQAQGAMLGGGQSGAGMDPNHPMAQQMAQMQKMMQMMGMQVPVAHGGGLPPVSHGDAMPHPTAGPHGGMLNPMFGTPSATPPIMGLKGYQVGAMASPAFDTASLRAQATQARNDLMAARNRIQELEASLAQASAMSGQKLDELVASGQLDGALRDQVRNSQATIQQLQRQRDQLTSEVNRLSADNQRLSEQLRSTGGGGAGGFALSPNVRPQQAGFNDRDTIVAELRHTTAAKDELQRQVDGLRHQLKAGIDPSGRAVIEGLEAEVRNARNQVAQRSPLVAGGSPGNQQEIQQLRSQVAQLENQLRQAGIQPIQTRTITTQLPGTTSIQYKEVPATGDANEVFGLRQQVSELKSALGGKDASCAQLQRDIDTLRAGAYNNADAQSRAVIDSLRNEVATLRQSGGASVSGSDGSAAALQAAQGTIRNLESQIDDMRRQAMSGLPPDAQGIIRGLQQELAQARQARNQTAAAASASSHASPILAAQTQDVQRELDASRREVDRLREDAKRGVDPSGRAIIQGLEDEVSRLRQQVQRAEGRVTSAASSGGSNAASQERISHLEGEVDRLRAAAMRGVDSSGRAVIEGLQAELRLARQQAAAPAASGGASNAQVQGLQSEVDNLRRAAKAGVDPSGRAVIDGLESEVRQLRQEASTAQTAAARNATAANQLSSAQAQVDQLRRDAKAGVDPSGRRIIDSLETEVRTLRNEATGAASRASGMQGQVSGLQNEVDSLRRAAKAGVDPSGRAVIEGLEAEVRQLRTQASGASMGSGGSGGPGDAGLHQRVADLQLTCNSLRAKLREHNITPPPEVRTQTVTRTITADPITQVITKEIAQTGDDRELFALRQQVQELKSALQGAQAQINAASGAQTERAAEAQQNVRVKERELQDLETRMRGASRSERAQLQQQIAQKRAEVDSAAREASVEAEKARELSLGPAMSAATSGRGGAEVQRLNARISQLTADLASAEAGRKAAEASGLKAVAAQKATEAAKEQAEIENLELKLASGNLSSSQKRKIEAQIQQKQQRVATIQEEAREASQHARAASQEAAELEQHAERQQRKASVAAAGSSISGLGGRAASLSLTPPTAHEAKAAAREASVEAQRAQSEHAQAQRELEQIETQMKRASSRERAQLQQQLEVARDRVDSAADRMDEANIEVSKTQQVAQIASQKENAEDAAAEADQQVEQLKRQLKSASGSQKRKIEKKLAAAKQQQAVANQELVRAESRLKATSPGPRSIGGAQAAALQEELHAKSEIIARLKKRNEGLQQEKQRILMEDPDQRVRSLAQDNRQLESEVDRLTAQIDALKAQVRAAGRVMGISPEPLDQDKENLKAEVEKLNGELEKMRLIIKAANMEQDAEAIQELIEESLQPMVESLHQAKSKIAELEDELQRAEQGGPSSRPNSGDGVGLNKEVNKLVNSCRKIKASYGIRKYTIRSADTDQEKLNKCIDIIMTANKQKANGGKGTPDLLPKVADTPPPTGSSLEEQVEYYQTRLKKTQHQAAKLSADLHGVMEMNDHLSTESSKLQGSVEDSSRKTEQMQRKNSKLKSQVARLREEVRKLDPSRERSPIVQDDSEENAKSAARNAKSQSRGLENELQRVTGQFALAQKVSARLQEANAELERKLARLQAEKEGMHTQMRDISREYERRDGLRDVNETSEILDMWKKRDEQALARQQQGRQQGRQSGAQVANLTSQLVAQQDELTGAKAMKDALERELEAQAGVSAGRTKTLLGLQEKLQQHFSKTYDELNEWKKREQDIKEKNRTLENELQQKTAECVRLRQKIKMLESSGKKGRRRRRSSAGLEEKPSSSDFSDTSSNQRSGDAWSQAQQSGRASRLSKMSRTDVGRKISSMRQQLTQMQKDRQRVFDEILKPIGSPMASPMSQPAQHRSPGSSPSRRMSAGRQRLDSGSRGARRYQ